MQDILIDTPSVRSAIHCGSGSFKEYAPKISGKGIFVITDSNVFKIYGELISVTFEGAAVHVIRAGEASKNYNVLLGILRHMISAGMTRSSLVVALGGGVVGDIAGLAASLYMRGVRIVQIPTTLLSQVDSSVGGKTAIDLDGVKNVVGTFYQPQEVIVDPMFLKSLPRREIRCGLGEIIKYGALDGKIYDMLVSCRNLSDQEFAERITLPCIQHKADVVTGDERDTGGARKTLNLGHTTGHAFELYYKRKSHGEFVLIGMYYEIFIAERLGKIEKDYADSLRKLISKVIGRVPSYADAEKAAYVAKYDKKNDVQSRVSIVAPCTRGRCQEIVLPIEQYAALIGECAAELRG